MCWDVEPIINIGAISVHIYGLIFAISLLFGFAYIIEQAKRLNYSYNQIGIFIIIIFALSLWMSRVTHCIFYDFEYYKNHVLEIFLPIKIDLSGSWQFLPFQGLASHGGIFGAILSLIIFQLITKQEILKLADLVSISMMLGGGFIRIGNFFNSEIVGIPTNVPWAVIFTKYDSLPRHPAQLYESLFYFTLFAIMAIKYRRDFYNRAKPGFYFGVICTSAALFRFFIEFIKEVQSDFEIGNLLNVGQLLTIPFIILGIAILYLTHRRAARQTDTTTN